MADANKGRGKARTVGVDEDGPLGLKYSERTQRRHFPQSDMQRGDRDELREEQNSVDQHEAETERVGP